MVVCLNFALIHLRSASDQVWCYGSKALKNWAVYITIRNDSFIELLQCLLSAYSAFPLAEFFLLLICLLLFQLISFLCFSVRSLLAHQYVWPVLTPRYSFFCNNFLKTTLQSQQRCTVDEDQGARSHCWWMEDKRKTTQRYLALKPLESAVHIKYWRGLLQSSSSK